MAEDEMVGWHCRLNVHEFEYAPGAGDGQRSLVCCSPCGHKESDTTECKELQILFKVLVAQSCPTLCDPMNSTFVHGILKAGILKGVAIPFSRGMS